ncbi:MAG: GAF domain-containing protein [Negativicutes bacterium]
MPKKKRKICVYFTQRTCFMTHFFLPSSVLQCIHELIGRYILIVAFVIGGRTEYLRNEAFAARQRERSTAALYQFSREIAAVVDMETIVRELALQVSRTLGRKTRVILPDANGRLVLWADQDPGLEWTSAGRAHQSIPENNENAVAMWSYTNGQVAGRSSETLSGADYLYLPMITRENVVGVLGVRVQEKIIAMEQRQLMNAWAGLAAIAIEKGKLVISIKDGANRMEHVVANLLDTARLESGMVQLKLNWCDLEDIIGTALRRLQESIRPLMLMCGLQQMWFMATAFSWNNC